MLRAILILVVAGAGMAPTAPATAQDTLANAVGDITQPIDGIAARIGNDVITGSEVRELSAFQKLVDGTAKPRDQVIEELADQWIVRGEADTAKYPQPSTQDVDRAYDQLVKQFSSGDEFQKRCTAAGLTDAAVRRQLALQLYLSRFLDYRFRPEVNVDDAAIQKYYDEEFAPQLKARGESVPPIEKVQDTIREVLVQRAISDRAKQWLDDTRGSLSIDVLPEGNGS